MAGGTLMISNAVNNHGYYKTRLEELGFPGVTLTALRRDALRSLIHDLKPELIMMGARYYHCSTPYMMGELHKTFPNIKMAALCIGEYPADLGMSFIVNGINSYVTSFDGIDQWRSGLKEVSKGREHISPEALGRLEMRREYPKPADTIAGRRTEVIRLICNGFTEYEMADTLEVSRMTVRNHKTEIFRSLNVRNPIELLEAARKTELLTNDELMFRPCNYTLSPKPDKRRLKEKKK